MPQTITTDLELVFKSKAFMPEGGCNILVDVYGVIGNLAIVQRCENNKAGHRPAAQTFPNNRLRYV